MRCVIASLLLLVTSPLTAAGERPPMREFMGINGHTVLFRPKLYAPVCRKVRDYHSLSWDLGKETNHVLEFPFARNRVNWDDVYGSWKAEGFETDVCVMFNDTPPDSWHDLEKDAHAYGLAFAKAFGPSSPKRLVTSVEIGNEPGKYSDEKYRALFQSMARGLREGDPKLQVVTCNMTTKKSGDYEKTVECVKGLDPLYDVLNTHTYAMADGWPTWRRSYPEDPNIDFLKHVQALIDWRNEKAKGKKLWVTEFGWDASTKPNKSDGDFAKWAGNVSDERQAQYLVRAFLLFAEMDVDRAYLYFFNDSNEPSYHGASGITRDFEPKASYHALAQMYRILGDYRFSKALQKTEQGYVFEFVHTDDVTKRILVAWSPSEAHAERKISTRPYRVTHIEHMSTLPETRAPNGFRPPANASEVTITQSPVYLQVE